VNWIHLVRDSDPFLVIVNTVMNLRVPYNAGNFAYSMQVVGA
jgi:hypothetical protein